MEKEMFAPDAPGELGEDLPNPDMLRRPTMRREAQSTSALEGTFEPLETVLAQDYEVGEDKSGLSESMREVLNYLDAAECGIGQIQSGHPISLPLVRELQKLLVKGTKSGNPQAGDIRSTQVFIGLPTRRIEDARFVPMPPGRIGRLLVLLQMMSRGLRASRCCPYPRGSSAVDPNIRTDCSVFPRKGIGMTGYCSSAKTSRNPARTRCCA
ncbi:Fic/DOC family N-terminal domain-containing protein [Bifidobacterium bifidum]|uniref:Fic/DOC family N-terminal domain-containing protein n=1 Tax=Bifidobacterium bifidum TaxID=1681 RepID=UPI003D08914C